MACSGHEDLRPCGPSFPSEHCCPRRSYCHTVLLGNDTSRSYATTSCPGGSNCALIKTITCDPSQYNATLHPESQVHVGETYIYNIGIDVFRSKRYFHEHAYRHRDFELDAFIVSFAVAQKRYHGYCTCSALGGLLLVSLILRIVIGRISGLPFKMLRTGTNGHEENISWGEPELEDTMGTQQELVHGESSTDRRAHELPTSRNVSELPV
ncbi:hypothetical protein SNOG_04105 [Parastagonospora nodorum SN15]|uniref:Uncharacterized protein n=1 Tax=Phaeosphaeria nodorum (strain SN15 / ATCC MYA-4574 / FGSC 10173) TaxID=321614 RepID=Q0UVV9_PHANO|nr:hypothetical protein SNOG_04105 [Parastagonospora nodorum SN15]EAT87865.1 hypothetical protein SNOG_04105 [Parastagonospora nodorum SN15]